MSPAPSHTTTLTDAALNRTPANDAAATFVYGVTERGPADKPYAVTSLDEFLAIFGGRTANSAALYDWVDTYFQTGGSLLYVKRRLGAVPVAATANIFDQSGSTAPGDVALVATARSKGAWANGLNVAVTVNGSNFQLAVTHDTDTSVSETSPVLADRAAALAWANDSSDYITLALGASNEDPRAGSYSLASGDDDLDTIADSQLEAELATATADYGFGRVAAPGATTEDAHTAILDHCAETFRAARLDFVDSATASDITDDATPLRDLDSAHTGSGFDQWAVVKGTTPGTTRTVPWSAVQCGMEARNLAAGLPITQPAAGRHGIPGDFVLGLSQEPRSAAELDALSDAGVNAVRVVRGVPRTYDDVTLADPVTRPMWEGMAGATAALYIANQADDILEDAMFSALDAKGVAISDVGGRLSGLCLEEYGKGNLYGATPEEAFTVDVGPTVNTQTTIANRELHAKLQLKTTESAHSVELTISKQTIA